MRIVGHLKRDSPTWLGFYEPHRTTQAQIVQLKQSWIGANFLLNFPYSNFLFNFFSFCFFLSCFANGHSLS